MRLDKFLAHTGFGSRKDVKKIILGGHIGVNGVKITKPEYHIDTEKDEVTAGGEAVIYTKYVYVLANKPAGVISAVTDADGAPTVSDLVAEKTGLLGLHPAGRLDKDATGLMILTNDGIFTHRVTSPKKNVAKVYSVDVAGELNEAHIAAFKNQIRLDDGYLCREARLEILESGRESKALVTITEGKFHQVKRMFRAIGRNVTSLRRISFAGINLPDDLEEGEARPLSEEEFALIEPYCSAD